MVTSRASKAGKIFKSIGWICLVKMFVFDIPFCIIIIDTMKSKDSIFSRRFYAFILVLASDDSISFFKAETIPSKVTQTAV